jgi:hypothetical protein
MLSPMQAKRCYAEPQAEIYYRIDAVLNHLRQLIEVKQRLIRDLAGMSPSDNCNCRMDGLAEKFYSISVKDAMVEKLCAYPECWDESVQPDESERIEMRSEIEDIIREIFRAAM